MAIPTPAPTDEPVSYPKYAIYPKDLMGPVMATRLALTIQRPKADRSVPTPTDKMVFNLN